jgi:hypothetical protein
MGHLPRIHSFLFSIGTLALSFSSASWAAPACPNLSTIDEYDAVSGDSANTWFASQVASNGRGNHLLALAEPDQHGAAEKFISYFWDGKNWRKHTLIRGARGAGEGVRFAPVSTRPGGWTALYTDGDNASGNGRIRLYELPVGPGGEALGLPAELPSQPDDWRPGIGGEENVAVSADGRLGMAVHTPAQMYFFEKTGAVWTRHDLNGIPGSPNGVIYDADGHPWIFFYSESDSSWHSIRALSRGSDNRWVEHVIVPSLNQPSGRLSVARTGDSAFVVWTTSPGFGGKAQTVSVDLKSGAVTPPRTLYEQRATDNSSLRKPTVAFNASGTEGVIVIPHGEPGAAFVRYSAGGFSAPVELPAPRGYIFDLADPNVFFDSCGDPVLAVAIRGGYFNSSTSGARGVEFWKLWAH